MTSNQEAFQSTKLDGVIWSVDYNSKEESLLLDVRKDRQVTYVLLPLSTLKTEVLLKGVSWWSNLECYDGTIYFSEYQSESDPGNKLFYSSSKGTTKKIEQEEIPEVEKEILEPILYKEGSEYFGEISNFLGEEISLASEYIEFENKIILSYYLRSENSYIRKIMIVDEGKRSEFTQDVDVQGFASGSFFVASGRLIFIKDRNEICSYTL